MTPREILDRWAARRDEWARLHVQVDGACLAAEVIADLERVAAGVDVDEPITYAKAVELSGYSVDHIGRLVRDGKLRNVGRKGAPRVLASELPKRPSTRIAGPRRVPYDPASDARSLRRSVVRGNSNGS